LYGIKAAGYARIGIGPGRDGVARAVHRLSGGLYSARAW